MAIDQELKAQLAAQKPAEPTLEETAHRVAFQAAAQRLKDIQKSICMTACDYMEKHPNAVLIAYDGEIYDVADEANPVQVTL